ncbi:putative oxidoreductase [Jannaschia faecimaris]|uniref:Putative oxidoreductase n=1 Tax=Jannaschia faecimaris TaxID=1244108 RepID=A0A1H3QI19_9RHOB|nr:DoxX family protein [Jannaschia faecimaris]SDZ12997.1 putative oxidoreductase [Jannaschia faecimaris]
MLILNRNDLATLLLRVALGVVLLAHSVYLKLFVFTLPGTAQFFMSIGLPGFLAYIVFAVEAVAGIMLVLGIQSRWAALTTIPVLIGATWAHWANGWMFAYENGGWEYPLYLTLLAFVQFLLGDGAFALLRSTPISFFHARGEV